MDAPQIKAFIDAMASSDLAEMEVSHDGWTLRLVRRPGAAGEPVATTAPAAPRVTTPRPTQPRATTDAAMPRELPAPMFGIVHLQSSPGAEPFVVVGDAVKAGQTVCTIEAMKVFNQVPADRDGIVDAVLVVSGAEVYPGQPLLRFR
ncbi:MAG: acetyl-CoA carboxylase biotin carboxyl carrier protein subunit [Burkholderiaceae bacterium]